MRRHKQKQSSVYGSSSNYDLPKKAFQLTSCHPSALKLVKYFYKLAECATSQANPRAYDLFSTSDLRTQQKVVWNKLARSVDLLSVPVIECVMLLTVMSVKSTLEWPVNLNTPQWAAYIMKYFGSFNFNGFFIHNILWIRKLFMQRFYMTRLFPRNFHIRNIWNRPQLNPEVQANLRYSRNRLEFNQLLTS